MQDLLARAQGEFTRGREFSSGAAGAGAGAGICKGCSCEITQNVATIAGAGTGTPEATSAVHGTVATTRAAGRRCRDIPAS